jgi:hypothetical protein
MSTIIWIVADGIVDLISRILFGISIETSVVAVAAGRFQL